LEGLVRFRLSPRDTAFYDMFTELAEKVREGVRLLSQALADDADRASLAAQLKEVEHGGDEVTHAIMRRVNSTFVTPFDREDIHRLATSLDDVLDEVEEAVDLMVLYRLGDLPSEVGELADVLDRAADLTAEAMPRLRTMGDLQDYWIEVNRLENVGDQVYRKLLARLFSGEYDALTVHKLKDVIDTLEDAVDSFEYVANTVEQIALKES
jgi:predicted phosphate transport protein (TIGR00153 family)